MKSKTTMIHLNFEKIMYFTIRKFFYGTVHAIQVTISLYSYGCTVKDRPKRESLLSTLFRLEKLGLFLEETLEKICLLVLTQILLSK